MLPKDDDLTQKGKPKVKILIASGYVPEIAMQKTSANKGIRNCDMQKFLFQK
jgi:hypothetical protein